MNRNNLYISLFSIHGLVRGVSPQLGFDADTGGQVKYVIELAKALAEQPEVAQVDLFTRRIEGVGVEEDYAKEIELLSEKAKIVRIRCGGKKYLRKELLWPHLEEFIDNTIRFFYEQKKAPDIFHGHYADAGYVAMELANAFDGYFISTGHSMGRSKLAKLISDGLSETRVNSHYKIRKRIAVEEKVMQWADLIVTSTQQEIDEQYSLYNNGKAQNFAVIPPGIDLEIFYPYYDVQLDSELLSEEVKQTRVGLLNELNRFWGKPEKPFILALCRPDQRKNISGLIEAYGNNKELQALANLAIFAGIRNDITTMEENERIVLTEMLLLMDSYDLYGKLAIPKKHNFSREVPELYRLCAESRGVFINPALVEPFGLTLIESSACGLPIVATDDGGPVDIIKNCSSGILVDVSNQSEIAEALLSLLIDRGKWEYCSNQGITGVRKHYSWSAHCREYLDEVVKLFPQRYEEDVVLSKLSDGVNKGPSYAKRLGNIRHLLITDIDNTLVGDDSSMQQIFQLLQSNRKELAWGVATGRSLELTLEAMTEYDFPTPDILICSVGTEIYYGPDLRLDKGWFTHLSYQWKPEEIKRALGELGFLVFQEAEGQRSHKISYYLEEKNNRLEQVREKLSERKLRCQIIYSHGQFLDILPVRASKGKAVEYLQSKFKISPRHIMVAGDSGNDEDMLGGNSRALIVANYSEELEKLRDRAGTYFSEHEYAAGIIEGLYHYGFIHH